jgi:hypothetical protein
MALAKKQPAAKAAAKGTKRMTDQNLAAELGLDTETITASDVGTVSAAELVGGSNARKAVKIGAIKRERLAVIPGIVRQGGNTGEGKYSFSSLEAPDTSLENPFDADFVEFDPSEDEKRFTRSVQAAYTKETAEAKAAGKPNKYIGRKVYNDDGSLSGIYVIRIDGHDVAGDEVEAE